MEIQGFIEHVIYSNEENHYTVMTVMVEEGEAVRECTVVGYLEMAAPGIYITASGEWVKHPQYEEQFRISTYTLEMPKDEIGMIRYLGSGIYKGLGMARAEKIVQQFGKDTFKIIEFEPERLAEIKGISKKVAKSIGQQFQMNYQMHQAVLYLGKMGIDIKAAMKIYEQYEEGMYTILRENPYQLAMDIRGIGFRKADEIAIRLGISESSDFRVRAAIDYTLKQSTETLGHICVPKDMLIDKAQEFLEGVSYSYGMDFHQLVVKQLQELIIEKVLVEHNQQHQCMIYHHKRYIGEIRLAEELCRLKGYVVKDTQKVKKFLEDEMNNGGQELDALQEKAVEMAAKSGLMIITGGPGTGKTTVINTIIQYFLSQHKEIQLAAPTGRAAKRMTEATGYEAQTIHRLLEVNAGDGGHGYQFLRNRDNPLEAEVLIVDEVSMVDEYLAYSLLQAVLTGTHVILVGDSDQLPSVGAGNFLRDCLNSQVIPSVRLQKIFRQQEGSAIVENAHRINRGEYPIMDNRSKDFFALPRQGVKEIIETLGRVVSEQMPKYIQGDMQEVQVLVPMRQGDLGVENLNRKLQEMLNPPKAGKREKKVLEVIFREGDRVMQTKNNYSMPWRIPPGPGHYTADQGQGVFNGDMGVITEVNEFAQTISVKMDDDKIVEYSYKQLEELEHAFALTIHKSQGSEYKGVVIPLLSGPAMLLNRNLLYTAVTRAKDCVLILGNIDKVNQMVDNATEQKRYSGLRYFLQEQSKIEEGYH